MRHPRLSIFIVGTDTEVGKTFQATILVRELVQRGNRVGVYKPVASGAPPSGHELSRPASDTQLLIEASGIDWPSDRVCPQSFAAAVAPPVAAQFEHRHVDEQLLSRGAEWWADRCDALIVEAAGGVLSPISHTMTVLDLAEQLHMPLILVSANRLGTINHTLLSLEAIQARQLPLLGVVLNDLPECDQPQARPSQELAPGDLSRDTNLQLLKAFAPGIQFVTSIVQLVPSL